MSLANGFFIVLLTGAAAVVIIVVCARWLGIVGLKQLVVTSALAAGPSIVVALLIAIDESGPAMYNWEPGRLELATGYLEIDKEYILRRGGEYRTAAALARDPQLISVLYATNRAIGVPSGSPIDPSTVGYQRSAKLTLGSALIRVPEEHKIGRIERPWRIMIFRIPIISQPERERSHFVIKQVGTMSRDQFIDAIRNSGKRSAVIFVHGYDNSFSDSIFRMAQIVWDTNISGIPVAFSWPSMAMTAGYDYDRESALFSKDAFLQLLELLHKEAAITSIFLIAHSMGNQTVADSIAHAQVADISVPLSEIAFAAPDVDRDVFAPWVNRLKQVNSNVGLTLYASSADKALLVSKMKAGGVPRAGDVPADGPLLLNGMDTIDVTSLGEDIWGHGVFSQSRSVIDDIGRLVVGSVRPPHVRSPQLRKMPSGSDAPKYWRYPE